MNVSNLGRYDPISFWDTIFAHLRYISELFICSHLFDLIFLSITGSPLTAGLTENGKKLMDISILDIFL